MLDTTIGGDKANSYTTVDEATEYYTADAKFSELWGALSEAERESWLRLAARSIDTFDTFRGLPQYEWQALAFPRVLYPPTYPATRGVGYPRVPNYRDRNLVPDTIPAVVKKAQLEMAAYLMVHKTGPGPIENREIADLKLLNGLVSLTYADPKKDRDAEAASGGVLERVRRLLVDLTSPVRWNRV